MLPCPRCQIPLHTHAVAGAVHYACEQCGGRAANLALLRRILTKDCANKLWNTVRDASPADHHGILRCPSCSHRMHPATVATDAGEELQLDVCRVCQIVWLDAGELERLPQVPPPAASRGNGPFSPEAAEALAPLLIERERQRGEASWGDGGLPGNQAPDHPLQVLLGYLGFPIEENAPSLRRRPWITWSIAAICLLVTVGAMAAGVLDQLVARHGFVPAAPWRGNGLTALSSFFIHGGILHLVFNMWFLIVAGDNCEDLLGAPRYLLLLAVGSLAALATHALFDPRPEIPLVGASGGISALLAFYALALPRVRLVICLRLGWYPLWLRMSAFTAMAIWVAGQFLGAFIQLDGMGHVSSLAHLGGAAGGAVAWWIMHSRKATV